MLAPDYAHWHGMFEVADRFYMKMIPLAREIVDHAAKSGKKAEAEAARQVIEGILKRPEHSWYDKEGAPHLGRLKPMAPPGFAEVLIARMQMLRLDPKR